MAYVDIKDDINVLALEKFLGLEAIDVDGDEARFHCPFPENHAHGDRTGKFYLNREKKVFICWVCHRGNLERLVSLMLNVPSDEALGILERFVGDADLEKFKARIALKLTEPTVERPTLPRFSHTPMLQGLSTDHPWFTDHHISKEVAEKYGAGYSEEAAKFYKGGFYTGPAILLPHFWKGYLVGWQYRWLDADRPAKIAKYTNSTGFPKKTTLYGYDYLEEDVVIVVESVATVLYLVSHGYSAVATFGAVITDDQIDLLRHLQAGVVIAPDNDQAGVRMAERASQGVANDVPVMVLPPVNKGRGADLADLDPSEIEGHLAKGHFV